MDFRPRLPEARVDGTGPALGVGSGEAGDRFSVWSPEPFFEYCRRSSHSATGFSCWLKVQVRPRRGPGGHGRARAGVAWSVDPETPSV